MFSRNRLYLIWIIIINDATKTPHNSSISWYDGARGKEAQSTLDCFYGSSDRKNTWPQYLRLFEAVAHNRRWTLDQKGQVLGSKLRGDALTAQAILPRAQWGNFDELVKALNARFVPEQKMESWPWMQIPGMSITVMFVFDLFFKFKSLNMHDRAV